MDQKEVSMDTTINENVDQNEVSMDTTINENVDQNELSIKDKEWYFPTSEKDVTEEVVSCSGKSVSKGGL